ncbi:DUF1353 domain-containing protein [Halomonas sp. AOP43-A1-21]
MYITTESGQFRGRDGVTVEVPQGYVTDFASIPRFAWSIMPPHGGLMMASIPHDWGYSHGGKGGFLPKAWWDALFHDLLLITPGVPKWKVPVAYMAVCFGGKGGWVNGWHTFKPAELTEWAKLGVGNGR